MLSLVNGKCLLVQAGYHCCIGARPESIHIFSIILNIKPGNNSNHVYLKKMARSTGFFQNCKSRPWGKDHKFWIQSGQIPNRKRKKRDTCLYFTFSTAARQLCNPFDPSNLIHPKKNLSTHKYQMTVLGWGPWNVKVISTKASAPWSQNKVCVDN